MHKQRITDQRLSEPGTQVYETVDIAQRRAAFWLKKKLLSEETYSYD